MWEIKNTELDIHIYGQTFEEAVNNTVEELMFLDEEDKNGTVDLKRMLLQMADSL